MILMTYTNIKEKESDIIQVNNSQPCVKRLWVVGCNNNFNERRIMISTLIKNRELFSIVPRCRDPDNKVAVLSSMKKINSARQFGIEFAANSVPKPSWILPLDGNTFITKESLAQILSALILDRKSSQYNFGAITMFRVIYCQQKLITDKFSFLDHLKSVDSKAFDNQEVVSEYFAKKDEAQIAVSRNESSLFKLFSSDTLYGNGDKVKLLNKLRRENKFPRPSCLDEFFNRKTSLNGTIDDVKNCGYVIRLQYWPENICEDTKWQQNETIRKKLIDEIKIRPEVSLQVREKLRQESMKKIFKKLGHE